MDSFDYLMCVFLGDESDEKSDFLEELKKQLNDFGKSVEPEKLEPEVEPVETEEDGQGKEMIHFKEYVGDFIFYFAGFLRKQLKAKAFQEGAAPAPKPPPPVQKNVKRKKQIKIEFKSEPAVDVEEEPPEDAKMSFDLNVFD